MNGQLVKFSIAFCLFASFSSATIKHKFLAIDNGLTNLLYVNEYDSTQNWIVPINASDPRDMQLIGNNRILIGHDGGYLEFDLTTGKVLKTVTSFNSPVLSENLGTASARRLENGNTLLTGVNIGGFTGLIQLEVDSLNVVKNHIIFPGNYVRLMRQTAAGTFLMACDTMIQEGDNTGTIVWKGRASGLSHAWKGVRLPNGHTLISAGYGAFMVELDNSLNVVRKFGTAASVPTAVKPNFYATFQLLSNGNVVVANWQGHGAGNGASGIQLLEFDPTGALVWQWSNAAIISSLQGVLVLDSLNTNLLYDERNGVMEPLTASSISVRTNKAARANATYHIAQSAGMVTVIPPGNSRYSATILTVAGRRIAQFSCQGEEHFDMPTDATQSGFLIVKVSDENREFARQICTVK